MKDDLPKGSDYGKAIQYVIMGGSGVRSKAQSTICFKTALRLLKAVAKNRKGIKKARAHHVMGHIYQDARYIDTNLRLSVKHYQIAGEMGIEDAFLCINELKRQNPSLGNSKK